MIYLQLLLLVVGFALLIFGADFFVDGASKIADRFGIPQLVIGLTIVAFGTSAPEAAISITAGIKGSADLAVSNVLGSNVMNILLILGVASLITPLAVQKSTIKYEIPFVAFVSVLLMVLGLWGGSLGLVDGIILWVFMILFLLYLIKISKNPKTEASVEPVKENEKPKKKGNILFMLLKVILGGAAIVYGSDVTVDAATNIATSFGMSERLIGLTIVAFGTSLPELITSTVAAIKKKADIAIGNIVGSNIFNILFVLGTTALVTKVDYFNTFIIDNIMAFVAAVILFAFVVKNKKLNRLGGAIMLIIYAAYFAYIFMNGAQPA